STISRPLPRGAATVLETGPRPRRFQKGGRMPDKRITVWVQERRDRAFLCLEWVDPDTLNRRSKSAATADPKGAERRRVDLEADLNNGRYKEASKLAWDRFRQLFQDEYLAGLRPRTREKYNTVLDVFEDVINPDRLRSVTERTVSAFVRGLRERKRPQGKVGLAPMSIKNYLISLKTALAWAVGQKLLPSLPKFPTVQVPKKKPQPVPAESFERLLEKAPDDLWRVYLLCGWWGGLRLSEALFLEWDPSEEQPWVDLPNNRIVRTRPFQPVCVGTGVALSSPMSVGEARKEFEAGRLPAERLLDLLERQERLIQQPQAEVERLQQPPAPYQTEGPRPAPPPPPHRPTPP